MKLRDHPLLSYRGVSSWPPVWVGKDARQLEQPKSEIAILKNVILSKTAPFTRCHLVIEHEGAEYFGALLFDDQVACLKIYRLLLSHRGEPIRKVGEIDVPQSGAVTIIKRRMCKVCGSLENCDFKVMDDVWRSTVPIEYRNDTVCIKCFENFASERQIQLLRQKGV
jgi:hypothetical protein